MPSSATFPICSQFPKMCPVQEAWLDFVLSKYPQIGFSSLPTVLDMKADQTQAAGLPTAPSSRWEMRRQVVTLMGPSLFK